MESFLKFLYQSPTAHFAVKNLSETLIDSEFILLKEGSPWELSEGKSYLVTRGQTALIAFTIPQKYNSFHFIGAHTDSPNLRLRHAPSQKNENYHQHPVEVYGGVLLHTWIDRDLAIAGTLTVNKGGTLTPVLVNINTPMFKIPSLAIHLHRDVNEKGLHLNKHQHFNAISGLIDVEEKEVQSLVGYIAETYGYSLDDIKGFDLSFYDYQKPSVIGIQNEFISSPRLDNLAMCYAGIEALKKADVKNSISVVALFDHEEVGSESYTGAAGSFLEDTLHRICSALSISDFYEMKSRSFFISADMAHAIHPNYKEKHDGLEFPLINKGPVFKYNANERYATNSETEAYLNLLAEEAGVKIQRFTNRQDLACGSTIGPAISTRIGVPTIDIGNPMLSMHSIRELCGVQDMQEIERLFIAFFQK